MERQKRGRLWKALIPFGFLGLMVVVFLWLEPTRLLQRDFPPVEEVSIQRAVLTPGQIGLEVINDGPDPVTIAQVIVDDAYWTHSILPQRTLPRLGRARIEVPYPWVHGEAHHIRLITATGVTFDKTIEVAIETPQPSPQLFGLFALLGIYVGVIPVAIGLLWLPALRLASARSVEFFLFLTVGLLLFLGFDALAEALEISAGLPAVLQGVGLVVIGMFGSFLILTALERLLAQREVPPGQASLTLAYLVATGIGLHNLGEGLAIGAAYALGNLSLGATLVLGFAVHNTTEGLAIASPLASTPVRVRQLALLGVVGGAPTVLGAWIGGFSYSAAWNLFFLAIGAGAIFQVAWQIAWRMASRRGGFSALLDFPNAAGLIFGFIIMYGTGFLVPA